jgi:hypothetical protein
MTLRRVLGREWTSMGSVRSTATPTRPPYEDLTLER